MKTCPTCGTEYADDAHFCSRDRTPLPGKADLTGEVLDGRYRIEAKLATGGMGEVYRATHVHIGRVSAIKVIGPDQATHPDSASRFRREALHASRITHPNVCTLYDFGVTPTGRLYLAMEYIEGVTLRQALETTPRFPPARVVAIARQCAAGLQAAHALGIVHRDLKPDNILLAPAPGDDRTGPGGASPAPAEIVKLVDFGIAKAMDPSAGPDITHGGLVLGTPEYMAPEQLAGDPVDARTDVYSLALVCYRMLTGALPFVGNTAQEALTRRLTHPPRPIADAAPGLAIPGGMERVLRKGLAQRPVDRHVSVTAFADALSAALAEEHEVPTIRLTRGGGRGGGEPVRRLRRRLLVGLAVAVALASVAVWAAVRPGAATDPASDALVPPPPDATDSADGTTGDPTSGIIATHPPALPSAPTRSGEPDRGPGREDRSVLALPSPEAITSDDPAVRENARRQILRLASDTSLPDTLRASAAFGLAEQARLDHQIDAQIHYLEVAMRLNPTPRYRDLLARARQARDSISL